MNSPLYKRDALFRGIELSDNWFKILGKSGISCGKKGDICQINPISYSINRSRSYTTQLELNTIYIRYSNPFDTETHNDFYTNESQCIFDNFDIIYKNDKSDFIKTKRAIQKENRPHFKSMIDKLLDDKQLVRDTLTDNDYAIDESLIDNITTEITKTERAKYSKIPDSVVYSQMFDEGLIELRFKESVVYVTPNQIETIKTTKLFIQVQQSVKSKSSESKPKKNKI